MYPAELDQADDEVGGEIAVDQQEYSLERS